jgi:hypothetical protein
VNCVHERSNKNNKAEYVADPEKQRRRSAAWRNRNKEREAARFQKWCKENPLRRRMKTANEKAARRNAPG